MFMWNLRLWAIWHDFVKRIASMRAVDHCSVYLITNHARFAGIGIKLAV